MSELLDFDNPWRPIYEWRQAAMWGAATVGCIGAAAMMPLPITFAKISAIGCAVMGLVRYYKARERQEIKSKATDTSKQFISIQEVIAKGKEAAEKNQLWLGTGFGWTDIEASKMHALYGQGVAQQLGRQVSSQDGAYWLHALGREQDNLIDMSLLDGHTLITGTTRVGKAQPLDAKVHTPDGWVRMGDIKPGMAVSTPSGQNSKVLEIFPQGERDIFELTTEDGRKTSACAEHLWAVRLIDALSWRTPNLDISIFPKKILTTKELIDIVNNKNSKNVIAAIENPVTGVDKKTICTVKIPFKIGFDLLDSQYNRVPDEIKENSKFNRQEFLRGLFERGAEIDELSGLIVFSSNNAGLVKDVQEIIWSLGGIAWLSQNFEENYVLTISHRTPHLLFSTRNINKFSKWKDCGIQYVGIDKIEYIGKKEAQCIAIEHPDHLYITDDYIVTHNTRCYDLLITQAIARGEPVIIIDPKGDHGLAENAKKACELLGEPERFIYFHPAHASKSVAIDPLANWNRRTELASRVAALIPSETGSDPFTAFGWKVINDIVAGLITTGKTPNLVELRRYIEGGPDDLLVRALRTHFKKEVKDWEKKSGPYVNKARKNVKSENPELDGYISFYKEVVIHESPNVDLAGLISTHEHNREHFQKMIASLIPILSMLTSDPLKDLLSPDKDSPNKATDMASIIKRNNVAYIGLDSLADSTVGSAIGSVFLADITAVAGDLYNYGIKEKKVVNIFVDEAAEVVNNPTIQLLNKAGGAGFRMFIATQTFADFAARLGDENKARQVLANTNNKITLRVLDSETQQYISDGIPKIKVKTMSVRYGHNISSEVKEEYSASYQEQSTEEEADLIPPGVLSELPPLHYFVRLSGGRTIKGRLPIMLNE